MWTVLSIPAILLSCFVGASKMEDKYKTGYFTVVGILFGLGLILTLLFNHG